MDAPLAVAVERQTSAFGRLLAQQRARVEVRHIPGGSDYSVVFVIASPVRRANGGGSAGGGGSGGGKFDFQITHDHCLEFFGFSLETRLKLRTKIWIGHDLRR